MHVHQCAQVHLPACVGNKKQAGAAFPSLECEEIRQLWNWTRTECHAYQRFISTGEELDEDQTIDGFDAHAEGDEPDEEPDEERAGWPPPTSLDPMDDQDEAALAHDDGSQVASDEVLASAAGVDEPRSSSGLLPPPPAAPPPAASAAATATATAATVRRLRHRPTVTASN